MVAVLESARAVASEAAEGVEAAGAAGWVIPPSSGEVWVHPGDTGSRAGAS